MSVKATKRIPLTPETWQKLRDFKNGMVCDYDQAIVELLSLVRKVGEDDYETGKRLRKTKL